MELGQNEGRNFPLNRFESMLKTNNILFFDADEFELITSHYLAIGNMALSKKAIKIALSQHPDSTELKLLQVELFLFENKLKEAGELLDNLYEIEPYNPDIYIHKADILSKNDEHQKAIDLLLTANEIAEDDDEILSLIAMEYMFLEDYENAKDYYMQCLELDDDDVSILYNIVYCFDFLETPEEAIHFLNTYLNTHPYSEIAWHQIGLQYKQIGDYEQALGSFEFAIISDDYFSGAHMEKGKILEELERYQEAIEAYRETLKLEDPTAFAYLHIAYCYEKINQPKLALKFYNKALQEDPLMDKTWLAITDFYCQQKKYQKALYYIERAIAIDEENSGYWDKYMEISEHIKGFDPETITAPIHFAANYESLEVWIRRIDFLISLDLYENALEMLQHIEKDYTGTAELEYRFAGVYLNLSKRKEGIIHLKRGLAVDPEYFNILSDLFPEVFDSESIRNLDTE